MKLAAFFVGAAMAIVPMAVVLLAIIVESLGWGAVFILFWCAVSASLMYYGRKALW